MSHRSSHHSLAPTETGSDPRFGRRATLAVVVSVLAVAAFGNSLGGGFVWDDRPLILDSPAVQDFSNVGNLFVGDFFSHSQNPVPYGYYRPITTLSYVVDWAVWEDDSLGFHLTNVGLHTLASVLVLFILLHLGVRKGPALATAALFAVHPIHSESVAWISGRTDVLAFVLTAAALLLYLHTHGHPVEDSSKHGENGENTTESTQPEGRFRSLRTLLLALSLSLFAAAMLTKEMAAVLPAWVVLIAAIHERTGWKRALLHGLPYATVVASYAASF